MNRRVVRAFESNPGKAGCYGEHPAVAQRSRGGYKVERQPEGGETVSDERLLAKSMAGDRAAFRLLVERYSGEVFQFVLRFTRSAAVAEDVVQETFLQVYQSAESFDPKRSFRPWLFAIAANKARDQLRSSTRRREVTLSAGGGSRDEQEVSLLDFLSAETASPGEAMEVDEQREVVRRIVSRMPDNLREVLVMGYYHHFPYKDIAEMLGIPLGTVKSRLHAAVSYFAEAYKTASGKETATRE